MDELISHASWMRDIPDDTPVTALSIPGTHNSGCADGPLGFAETQDLDVPDQLNAGIRFLDIRLALCEDDLFVHHDVIYMDKSYTDVLTMCSSFLEKHPSETILMSIKDESRADSGLGKFAPSEVLGKLSRGDTTIRNRKPSFEEVFRERTRKHTAKTLLFYNFASDPGTSAASIPELTSETTIGVVRGKIILLRRFESSEDVGFDLTYWPENQTFRSAASPMHIVHDRYQGLTEEAKHQLVIAHLEEAKNGDLKDLYITFSSAVDLKARGFAEAINPRLNDYLTRSAKGRVGIIAMDYFEQPRELVSNVIKMNTKRVVMENGGTGSPPRTQ